MKIIIEIDKKYYIAGKRMRLVHKSELRPGPRVEQLRNVLGVLQLAVANNRVARRTSA